MAKKITFDELYEIITDEKTYVIIDLLRGGERSSADMITESGIFLKTFNYIVSRMYNAGMLNSRTTIRTRIYSLNIAGIRELVQKLTVISGEFSFAAGRLTGVCR